MIFIQVPNCPNLSPEMSQYRNVSVPNCLSQYRNVSVSNCPSTELSRIPSIQSKQKYYNTTTTIMINNGIPVLLSF